MSKTIGKLREEHIQVFDDIVWLRLWLHLRREDKTLSVEIREWMAESPLLVGPDA